MPVIDFWQPTFEEQPDGNRTPNRLPFHRYRFSGLLAQFVVYCWLLLWGLAMAWSRAGYSGLCGGLILPGCPMCILLTGLSVLGRPQQQTIVRSFYAGEAGKLILTAVLLH